MCLFSSNSEGLVLINWSTLTSRKFCIQDQHSHHLSSFLTTSTMPLPQLTPASLPSDLTGITTLMVSLLLHFSSFCFQSSQPVEASGMLRASSTEQFVHLFTLKTISIPNSNEGNLIFSSPAPHPDFLN